MPITTSRDTVTLSGSVIKVSQGFRQISGPEYRTFKGLKELYKLCDPNNLDEVTRLTKHASDSLGLPIREVTAILTGSIVTADIPSEQLFEYNVDDIPSVPPILIVGDSNDPPYRIPNATSYMYVRVPEGSNDGIHPNSSLMPSESHPNGEETIEPKKQVGGHE